MFQSSGGLQQIDFFNIFYPGNLINPQPEAAASDHLHFTSSQTNKEFHGEILNKPLRAWLNKTDMIKGI